MLRRLLTPALAGGAVIGVLSALPVFAWGNACCCLWILLGGVTAAYLLQQQQPESLTATDGALAGAAAGLVGAVVYLLVSIPVTLLTTPLLDAVRQRLIDAGAALPPALDGSTGAAGNVLLIVGSFLVMLFVGPVAATVGGLLGALAFRRPPAELDIP